VGFKPTPTIAAAIAALAIPAEPAARHHNRAIRKTEWTYEYEHKHFGSAPRGVDISSIPP